MKIALLGLAGAGKDTSAIILQRILAEQGLDFKIDRYAAPLKKAARQLFGSRFDDRDVKEIPFRVDYDRAIDVTFSCLNTLGFTDEEHDKASGLYFDTIGLKTLMSPREYQQLLGTEVVRATRKSAWVDRIREAPANLIITDTRFANEMTMANLIIERFENIDRPKHESEHLAWDLQFTGKRVPVDLVEVNNRKGTTLEELEVHLRNAIKLLNFKEVI